MLNLFLACVFVTFSSHRQSSTGSVVVTATCATSPLSQITSNTKNTQSRGVARSRLACTASCLLPQSPDLALDTLGLLGASSPRAEPVLQRGRPGPPRTLHCACATPFVLWALSVNTRKYTETHAGRKAMMPPRASAHGSDELIGVHVTTSFCNEAESNPVRPRPLLRAIRASSTGPPKAHSPL